MILRRLGNKKKIAGEIQKHFPKHTIYIEPFFGAGGMFFNKPKARHNIMNDLDSDVFNLFQVVMNQKECNELIEFIELMPIHHDLFQYWRGNKEEDKIKKAARFLFLSNFGYMGKLETLRLCMTNTKKILLLELRSFLREFGDFKFSNKDFRSFLKAIALKDADIENTFIYCDPPCLTTVDNYSNSFTQQDSIDLFDCLEKTGCKFAMSEFDNPFILEQAKQRGLNVIIIGERQNLKNRRTEILVTNYDKQQLLFDL